MQNNARFYRGQGATEYIVLLAVVLIVALVSMALLGFFPGMALDSKITQSQVYWQGTMPISVTEWYGGYYLGYPRFGFRMRNSGAYPIRLTGVIGGDNGKIQNFYTVGGVTCTPLTPGYYSISDYFYLAPGEEKYFAPASLVTCERRLIATTNATGTDGTHTVGGAQSTCQDSASAPGIINFNSIGFEYIQYIENTQITKRQIGKQVIIKCLPPV